MKRMKMFCLISLLLIAIISLTGCPPEGSVIKHTIHPGHRTSFNQDFRTVWQGCLKTIKEMGIKVKEKEIREAGNIGIIRAKSDKYNKIVIRVTALTSKATKINVKVQYTDLSYELLGGSEVVDPEFEKLVIQTIYREMLMEKFSKSKKNSLF